MKRSSASGEWWEYKMKVVLTVHQFVPDYAAGTEVLTFETAKGLKQRGHDVCVVTAFPDQQDLRDEERFDSYSYQGIRVERFRHGYVPMGAQSNITEIEYRNELFGTRFRDLLESMQPDIVHFFHLARLSASLVEASYQLGIPTVLTPTDFWFVCPTVQLRLPNGAMCRGPNRKSANCLKHLAQLNQAREVSGQYSKLPDWLLGITIWANQVGIIKSDWFAEHIAALVARHDYLQQQLNNVGRVLVPTRLMEDILTYNGLRPDRVAFAPYGINLAQIQRHPRPGGDKLHVGFIGTLYEHKGVDVLVRAVRSLDPDLPLELKIFGRLEDFPDYSSELRRLAADDPRICFCGTFPNASIGEIFDSLDVLVVPSIWYENTPLVIYSAQAAGCPVVASDLPGMAEVIHHEDNGLLFPPRSIVDLAKALRRLCADRALLHNLAKHAIMPRSILDYVNQVEGVYEEVVAEGQDAFNDCRSFESRS